MSAIRDHAAIDDPALRAAYATCRRLTKTNDPDIYAAVLLMPPPLRPACWAMWGAVRVSDDLADTVDGTPHDRTARVRAWACELAAELPAGTSTDPVRWAFIDAMHRWGLDPEEMASYLAVVSADPHGRHFSDWREWSAWGQDNIFPWAGLSLTLLERVGVPVPVRLEQRADYGRLADGFRLTDVLTDLAADLARGELLLPDEVLGRFPDAAPALRERRWTQDTAALITHLSALARQWLHQPYLTRGMHPAPAALLRGVTEGLIAQLDAIDAAGPALLRRMPRPPVRVRWRVLARARTRAALAWHLTPLTVPPARPATPSLTPATDCPVLPPRPHPSGAKPPRIPPERMPRHVAVIMDGNRRWAAAHGLPATEGHRRGFAMIREMVHGALEIGLRNLTLYAFSTENWKRDADEIDYLFGSLRDELRADERGQYGVRLRWSGRPEGLPADLVDNLTREEARTRHHTKLTLTMCINYGGRAEIVDTAAALARAAVAGDLDPGRIGEDDFARHLPLPGMPDVDLLWRTSGEHRTSNFLPWQATYAELHFTAAHWPDTDRLDLWQAISEYTRRERRHGGAKVDRPSVKALEQSL
ncbi:polyprenyl diphosphate synthase [Streptomyces sp. NPDC020799]|uniref:polyprenyl diphosphate synthase n=1 Tax=Streptomyces sp. NPDC020799 TaxID=3365091 RepID=UPI00379F3429